MRKIILAGIAAATVVGWSLLMVTKQKPNSAALADASYGHHISAEYWFAAP